MKLSSPDILIFGAAVVITGPALLAGPEFGCVDACDYYATLYFCTLSTSYSGPTKGKGSSNRNLEEVGAGDENVVMGTDIDPDTNKTFTFFATNATKAEKFRVGFTKSEECTDEAHSNALITQVSEERRIITDTPGARGWHMQRVTQIDDDETPALNDFITGAVSNYTLVAFFYDLQEDLVECAPLKQHDEDMAAMYNALLEEVAAAKKAAAENVDAAAGGDDAAVAVKDTSSGSKNGRFAVVSAFAAIGIAVVLGGVLAF